jgi:hypothetical protein
MPSGKIFFEPLSRKHANAFLQLIFGVDEGSNTIRKHLLENRPSAYLEEVLVFPLREYILAFMV